MWAKASKEDRAALKAAADAAQKRMEEAESAAMPPRDDEVDEDGVARGSEPQQDAPAPLAATGTDDPEPGTSG
jgi:TRAP-type C4-dicarboxylate transport system substrate-binding protein